MATVEQFVIEEVDGGASRRRWRAATSPEMRVGARGGAVLGRVRRRLFGRGHGVLFPGR
jgi:hypothetical protein